jgi:hypothetical protein
MEHVEGEKIMTQKIVLNQCADNPLICQMLETYRGFPIYVRYGGTQDGGSYHPPLNRMDLLDPGYWDQVWNRDIVVTAKHDHLFKLDKYFNQDQKDRVAAMGYRNIWYSYVIIHPPGRPILKRIFGREKADYWV